MTIYEKSSGSIGNISFFERVTRVIWGLAVLVVALHLSIIGDEAYPLVKLVAAIVVLTGIVGWDPLNAVLRSAVQSFRPERVPVRVGAL